MPELARLGLLVAEAERQRQARGEGASAQVEHARTFDPAIADQGHVRGAAPDVDEDAALGPRLLPRATRGAGPSAASPTPRPTAPALSIPRAGRRWSTKSP